MLRRLLLLSRRPEADTSRQPMPAAAGKPEAAVLLRHLANIQQRCSETVQAQARRIEALENLTQHLQHELLQRDAALRAMRESPNASKKPQTADEVICRTGCISHNYYWRSNTHCQRKDSNCHHATTETAAEEDAS